MKLKAKIVKSKDSKNHQLSGILKRFKSLDNENVQIGYFDGERHDKSKMTYGELMNILEGGWDMKNANGESIGRVEGRPIFATTAEQLHPSKNQKSASIIKKMIKDLSTEDKVLSRLDELGELYQNHMKNKFGNPQVKGNRSNRPSVIKRKGANTPLVDEGDLRDNLSFKNSKTKEVKRG